MRAVVECAACGQCTPAYMTVSDQVHLVLATLPMSLSGALIFLCLDFAMLSPISHVGLITLVGLISKRGILMVDFARRLQGIVPGRQDNPLGSGG